MRRLLVALLLLLQPLAAAEGRLTDAEVEALARQALVTTDADLQAKTLHQLRVHHFKSSVAKEREVALYAQGTLEDRLGQPSKAAATFHRLEKYWPNSAFLPETQVVMAQAALDHKRPKEAEQRLRKALAADLPAESARRSQELLLFFLAEQGRTQEGLALLDGLKPLGSEKPSEQGLVGIMETLCLANQREQAQATVKEYHRFYPKGPRLHRVDLAWAKLLGTLGEAHEAAKVFQKLIQSAPNAKEADEARLALATLLTDGRLTPKQAQLLPNPATLLAELERGSQKDSPARQTLLVKLRLNVKDHQWREALETTSQFRALHPGEAEALLVSGLRAEALRSWAQELLDQRQAAPILPFLDKEGIRSLTAAQRLSFAKQLAEAGLPEASRALADTAPAAERAALLRAAQEVTGASNPKGTLALLPAGGGTPQENLLRAQANAGLGAWPETRSALAKARPGPERIGALLALLNRPLAPKETAALRLKEVEGWLARAPEKGPDREPLLILAADLHTRAGSWREALALYPSAPQPANRSWVALMRATCLARLGQKAPAKAALKLAADDPAYKTERSSLAATLGE